jgi:alpha-glucoside transport system permease protein
MTRAIARAPAATAATTRPTAPRWLARVPVNAAVILLMVVWSIPTLGLIVSSFRPPSLVQTTGWWTAVSPPLQLTIENYQRVLNTNNMATSFVNSLVITIPATVIPIAIATYAAYAFSWMRFPGRNFLFLVLVGLLVVPLQTTLVPVLRLFTAVGLTGTFVALWLAHTGYGLPLTIYLMRNFIGALPRDLFEAAAIDGAGALGTFFRIVVPLSVPALASVAIFQFLWVWNDLLVALVYVGGTPNVAPVTVTVSNLVNSLGQNWQLLTAAAFIASALPLVVFISLQRYFVRGMLAGSYR